MKKLFLLALTVPYLAFSSTFYVNGTTGSDSNSGTSSSSPKKTIQAAISAASNGDTVTVASGTYAENLNISKRISLIAQEPLGVTINGRQSGHCIQFATGASNTVIDGFVIYNGASTDSGNRYGAGIDCCGMAATIRNCHFKNNGNSSQTFSGGLQTGGGGDVLVYNCLFTGNRAWACGGAALSDGGGGKTTTFDRCTIYGNVCSGWNRIGGVGVANSARVLIKNSIVWGNSDSQVGSYSGANSGSYSVAYSCVFGGCTGTGNISSNPAFVNATGEDFELSSFSPCIGAGDPGDTELDGSRANMGFSLSRISSSAVSQLSEALNIANDVTTGGNANWTSQTATTHDGMAAKSGTISGNQSSWMQTTVMGPARISFWWRVSSEGSYDWLEFQIDGSQQDRISGTGGYWAQKTYTLASGSHTLKWNYYKDGSVNSGDDCGWVDQLIVSPLHTVSFNANGGSSTPSSVVRESGAAVGTLPTATRTGYEFLGWFTAASGGEQVTAETVVTADVTFYAHWRQIGAFAETLDMGASGLVFTTGGNANWYVQSSMVYSGSTAMRSGTIGHSQSTWMQTTVVGPATVSFYWKVSSESVSFDWLEFDIDGTQQNKIGGTGNSYWEQKSYTLSSGSHTLKWLYRKDGSQVGGSDCGWVDKLVVSRTISFNLNGGSGSVSSITRNMGQTFGSLPTPAMRSGYAFDGWFTAATGGTQVTSETIVMTQTTLYAHWHSLSSEVAMAMNASGREFTMGGSANWCAGSDAGAGFAFVRSGEIGNSQETWLETMVEGRKLVTFDWKSSSESDYDYLKFLIDGQEVDAVSGVMSSWSMVSNIVNEGSHTLRWVYSKDGGTVRGDDCGYVRNLQFIELPDNVFFDGNGGVAELEADYREVGTPFGELPTAEREGYDFVGWFLADGIQVTDGTIVPEGEVTLYARWEATQGLYDSEWTAEGTLDITSGVRQVRNAIALTYDSSWTKNGASVMLTTNGSDFAAAAGAGAQTWSGGHSGTYALAHQVLDANGDPVGDPLTASVLWITQSAVSFNLNGGAGEFDPQTFDNGLGYGTLPTIAADARPGYTPVGWFTAPQGGTQVTAATVASEDVTQLYVQWTANVYTVVFDANGGEGEMEPQTFTYDVEQALTSNAFTRTGYTFAGWCDGADGEGAVVTHLDGEVVSNLTTEAGGVVTLYAVWQGNPYTVRFDANGGFGSMEPQSFVYDEDQALNANAFFRPGYAFAGWSLGDGAVAYANGETVSNLTDELFGEVELFAVWTALPNEVTFAGCGGTPGEAARSVLTDQPVGALPTAVRTGYAFAGWYTSAAGGSAVTAGTVVTAPVTFYAHWTANEYTIDFDGRGGEGEMPGQPMEYDVEAALDENLFRRTGYTFLGWTDDEAELEEVLYYDGVIVSNLTSEADGTYDLYAVWAANASAVVFDANGGEGEMDAQEFLYDEAQPLDENAFSCAGYAFAGWSTNAEGEVVFADGAAVSNLTAEADGVVTLYAQWTANAYTVEFDANGGEGEMGPQAFTYDVEQALTSNAFTRTGYAFAGWARDAATGMSPPQLADAEVVCNLTAEADGTVTLYAVWQGNPYTVRFDANGGEGEGMEPYAAVYGEEYVLPDNTYAIPGYMPVGWSLTPTGDVAVAEGGCFSNLTAVAGGEVTLYAQWAPNEYSVCFNANGGDGWMDDEPFVYFEEQELAANEFYRCGYVFTGWTGEDGRTFADGELVSNLTTRVRGVYELSAVWTPVSYAVRFDANGGSGEMADLPMTYDEVSALTSNGFSRVGYSFVGWTTEDAEGDVVFCDGEDVENLVNVQDGSITLYAVWQPNEYRVRYDANGGFGSMYDQWFVFDEIQYLRANAFSRYGCTFIGWSREPNGAAQFADGELVENLTVEPDAEVVLYAVWNPTVYTISYDLAGGVNASGNPAEYTVFDLPLVLEPPTREYSEFDHWEPLGEIPAETTGDLSFVAVWKTLHLNGMVIEGQSLTCWEGGGDLDVVIPQFVTEIADGAFKGHYEIKSVTLPDGLERIGNEAFSACTGLKRIVIPDTVREVGDGAFLNCTMLTEIQLPGSVERIGSDAFRNCSSLLSVDLPEGLQTIGNSAFYDCWSLMFVSLPLSLKEIGEDVFGGCDNINGVSVPTHLVTLADLFPDQYDQIETASVPEGELQIKEGMFMGCSSLKSVSWPESVVVIGQYAFANCTGFGDINIPDGVRGIGEYAFYGCSGLINIALPQTLEIVESHAFAGCGAMRAITMPENVSVLGSCLFPSSVVSVNFLGDAPTANADLYQGTSSQLTTYVLRGTTGWDGIPGSQQLPRENWHGRPIAYLQADEFDVTFDGNGGSPAQQVVGQQTQQGYVLPLEQPKRAGYVFAGWWTSRELGGQVTANTKVTVTHPHTLYAHWAEKANTVEIRFNANGGTVNPDVRMYGESLTYGDFPVATRTGYRFLGWYTMATGGERVTEAMPVPSAPTTLFAHWTENTYSVVFHSNREGEEFVDGEYTGETYQQMLRWSETANLYKNRFVWDEHNFTGWANPDNGEVAYYDGEPVNRLTQVYGASVHLFATWSGANYAVRFNGNGGSGHMDDQQFTAGIRSALAPNEYSRAGYVFKGWATTEARAASGTIDYLDRQRILDGAEIGGVYVLFAVWQPESASLVDILLNYNDGGNGSMTAVVSANGVLGALPVPERIDYEFTGWHAATDDGTVVNDKTSVQSLVGQKRMLRAAVVKSAGASQSQRLLAAENVAPRQSATLVAGWRYVGEGSSVGCEVSFDACGGTTPEPSRIVIAGDAVGSLPTATCEGWTFLGWFTMAAGGDQVTFETVVEGDVTFYAHWEEIVEPPPEEPVDPSTPTNAPPTIVDEAEAHVDVAKGEVAPYEDAAAVYDGYLYDGETVVGSVQVKVAKGKVDKKSGVFSAKVTATVQMVGETKKLSFKGGLADQAGAVTRMSVAGHELDITVGVNGLGGTLDGNKYKIDGARNVFSGKSAADKAAAEKAVRLYQGVYNVAFDGGTLSVSVDKKGKAKIAGTVNGNKVSTTSQLVVGDSAAVVPVVIVKKVEVSFCLWVMADGTVAVRGADSVTSGQETASPLAGKAGALKADAKFVLDVAAANGLVALPGLYGAYLPNGIVVEANGTKWVVAGGAKAGKVAFVKGGNTIDESKLGANPSGLKLSYKQKDGTFKGSFKAYNLESNGKIKAYTANVTGVMIGNIGYGTATIKKPACTFPISIE